MRRALFSGPRKITLEEVPRPVRKPDEALLKVRYIGICGTDLHTYQGSSPIVSYPIVPGHELCCEVIESDQLFSPGEWVVVEPLLSCGTCYPCHLGRYNCCEQLKVLGVQVDGGMAEEIVLPTRLLHRLPKEGAPSFAPLVEMLSIGYHACNRGRVECGDRLLVIGAGPIGLGAALVAKERGARVAVVDKLDSRLRMAKELGSDVVLAATEDLEQQVIQQLGGRPTIVMEAVGHPRTMQQAVEIVSAAGRVVFVGWTSESPRWEPQRLLRKELDLLGSRNSRGIFPDVIRFYCRNLDKVKQLVTHRFKMDQIEEAMQFLDRSSTQAMKVVLEW